MPCNIHPRSQKRRYYVDVALPIGRQTTALWLVFPEDLEEAAEMLAER